MLKYFYYRDYNTEKYFLQLYFPAKQIKIKLYII